MDKSRTEKLQQQKLKTQWRSLIENQIQLKSMNKLKDNLKKSE